MKCPHCLVEILADVENQLITEDLEGKWGVESYHCPNPKCQKCITKTLGVCPSNG
jgi:hypothetical protein